MLLSMLWSLSVNNRTVQPLLGLLTLAIFFQTLHCCGSDNTPKARETVFVAFGAQFLFLFELSLAIKLLKMKLRIHKCSQTFLIHSNWRSNLSKICLCLLASETNSLSAWAWDGSVVWLYSRGQHWLQFLSDFDFVHSENSSLTDCSRSQFSNFGFLGDFDFGCAVTRGVLWRAPANAGEYKLDAGASF